MAKLPKELTVGMSDEQVEQLVGSMTQEQLDRIVAEFNHYESLDDAGKVEALTKKLVDSAEMLHEAGRQIGMMRDALMGASSLAKQMLAAILGDEVDRAQFVRKHSDLVDSFQAATHAEAESKRVMH